MSKKTLRDYYNGMGSLRVLAHADDENMKSTAKKGALIASKPRGPELNAVKIKYMFEE